MNKKIISILLAIAVITTTAFANPLLARRGDVNGDNFININDALEILKYLASLDGEIRTGTVINPRAYNAAAQITQDDSITINDALEILKCLAGLPSVFDTPQPREFSLELPLDWIWVFDEYNDAYMANNYDHDMFIDIVSISLDDMLYGFDVQSTDYDIIGLGLEQAVVLMGMSFYEFIDEITQMVIEDYPQDIIYRRAVIGGLSAVRFEFTEFNALLYLVFDSYGVYSIMSRGNTEKIEDIIRTFKLAE
jgi:hypothetical protein